MAGMEAGEEVEAEWCCCKGLRGWLAEQEKMHLLRLLGGSLFEAGWLVQLLEEEVEVFQWEKVLLALATPCLG